MNQHEPLTLVLAVIASFSGAFLILPVLIKYAHTKNLVVEPGERSIHKRNTPTLGGISIFFGFLIATFFWIQLDTWIGGRYILGSLFIIFLLGVRDDLVPFSAWNKMVLQVGAIIVLLFSQIRINSLYGLFGVEEIPLIISLPLTFFFILIVTNAYNLIDGLDGLASTIGIIAYLAFGLWFYFAGEYIFSLLCFSMLGGLIAFFVFNWEPAEIFMGDSGAMVNGMLIAAITIQFMNSNYSLQADSTFRFNSSIGAAASFIIVPLFDTVRIIILRLSKGISPLTADKNHLHHGLVRLGLSHSRSVSLLALFTLMIIGLNYWLRVYGNMVIILSEVAICVVLGIWMDRLLLRKEGDSASV